MVILAEYHRIHGLHTRARELIDAATSARDRVRRQHLMDLASAHERVAAAFELQVEKRIIAGAKRQHDETPAGDSLMSKRRY